jgi:transposase
MTSTWRSREELVHQIVTLAADGMSKRAITRAVGVSRNTVKAVLAAHAAERAAPHSALPAQTAAAPRPKKTDAFRGQIAELFVRYPDITARRVFEILRDEGFDGGYTAVKKHVRTVRAPRKSAPSLVAPESDGSRRMGDTRLRGSRPICPAFDPGVGHDPAAPVLPGWMAVMNASTFPRLSRTR